MPRVPSKVKLQPGDWRQAVLFHLREGKLLPIVSNRLHDDLLLGGHQQLIQDYAERFDVYRAFSSSLPTMAQYNMVVRKVPGAEKLVKSEYLDFVKTRLLEQAEALGVPPGLIEEEDSQFDKRTFSEMAANFELPRLDLARPDQDPLLILAHFDLPVYLTTSPHLFLERALEKAGKRPRTEFCCWWPANADAPLPSENAGQPSKDEPMVYHLHGLDSQPESLVLSEDDHLSFLVDFSQSRIPPRLRQAMAESSLLLIGYDLAAWDFRTLFYGLVKKRPAVPRRQSVCVLQLQPSQQEEERQMLDFYMEQATFKVAWEDFAQYLRQLNADLNRCA